MAEHKQSQIVDAIPVSCAGSRSFDYESSYGPVKWWFGAQVSSTDFAWFVALVDRISEHFESSNLAPALLCQLTRGYKCVGKNEMVWVNNTAMPLSPPFPPLLLLLQPRFFSVSELLLSSSKVFCGNSHKLLENAKYSGRQIQTVIPSK